MKKHKVKIIIGLLLTLFFSGHVSGLFDIKLLGQLDNIIYDARLRLGMPGGIDERIVILDIDEKSLAVPELGRWPWGQEKMARIIDVLFEKYEIKVLGFDMVWAEKDRGSGLEILRELAAGDMRHVPEFASTLKRITPKLDHEAILVKALRDRPVVLGYYFNTAADALESGTLPEPVMSAGSFADRSAFFQHRTGYGANLPALTNSAPLSGHFNPVIDSDGVIRRVPLFIEYKGEYYESLALAMVRLLIGIESPEHTRPGRAPDLLPGAVILPEKPDGTGQPYGKMPLNAIGIGPVEIPVDPSTNVLVPYRGGRGSYPYISLADVYAGTVPKEKLQGKIALVGTTALGLADLRSTPVGAIYPGVEVHANMIAGMISQQEGAIKVKPDYVAGAELAILLGCGLLFSFVLAYLSPLGTTFLVVVGAIALAAANYMVWLSGIMLPLASTLVLILMIYVSYMAYGYLFEARSKRQFTELFGQYVPPELVSRMAEAPQKYSMSGRKETLTVLFSDVVGFTSISERLSPHDLAIFINEYLTTMSMAIRNTGGTLDKYIGDAIMAFWGAPVADDAHATHAVMAALVMQEKVLELRENFRARGWPSISIGIGVSTGEMTVGDMGSKIRRAYTVMGDAVNLGSRLEGITRQYGVGILVTEETARAVKGVLFREIDMVRVKGKENPIRIYQPLGIESEGSPEFRAQAMRWSAALDAYRSQQWDLAESILRELRAIAPEDGLYGVYLERVAEMKRVPPPADWDGVKKFDSK
jgi:adenylate cyclase